MPIPVVSSLDKSVVYEKGTTSIIYLSNCISGDYKGREGGCVCSVSFAFKVEPGA